ncbi:leukocyte elastase inhibitor-like [Limulus polyphemus]|uniref:Leukocyte elastase inhibitor-like n=1 Tax=Limulus polyphemus TaxID=6850 RepID=A0ABM1TGD1_LIMPO|nr:leukocyte elastase inhibitor-like [Limulus polyphemus]
MRRCGLLLWLSVLMTLTTSVLCLSYAMRKVAFATNQLGMDILRTMEQEVNGSNVAFSPLSISTTLAAVMIGSRGNSILTLRHALYLWGMHPQQIHEAFHDLLLHLADNLQASLVHRYNSHRFRSSFRQDDTNGLLFYSSLYVQRDYSISYPFQVFLHKYYNITAHSVDFCRNGEETRNHINAIVAKETASKIMDILPDLPEKTTNMLFLSGVYFQGLLNMKISITDDSSSGDVPPELEINSIGYSNGPVLMEAKNARVRYGVDSYLNCTAIEVPLKGGFLSMLILLPVDPEGMSLLETRLSAQRLSDFMFSMAVKRINLQMPRISLEDTYQNFSQILSSMGLADVFTPGYANLFGISPFRWLHVTDIIHKTKIEIKEDESDMRTETSEDDEAIDLKLDRPFLYFIMDSISGLAIVLGKFSK